jgi:hypothetical protein
MGKDYGRQRILATKKRREEKGGEERGKEGRGGRREHTCNPWNV